jgi:hypothetical protein
VTFNGSSGVVYFPAGVTQVQVLVKPVDDSTAESDENVALSLTAGSDYRIGAPAVANGIITSGEGELSGDFNNDGYVDGVDFLLWQRQFGGSAVAPGAGADADSSGFVDGDDLTAWKSDFSSLGATAALTNAQSPSTSALNRVADAYHDRAWIMLPMRQAESARPGRLSRRQGDVVVPRAPAVRDAVLAAMWTDPPMKRGEYRHFAATLSSGGALAADCDVVADELFAQWSPFGK